MGCPGNLPLVTQALTLTRSAKATGNDATRQATCGATADQGLGWCRKLLHGLQPQQGTRTGVRMLHPPVQQGLAYDG